MAEYIEREQDRYIKLSQALEVLDSCACWWAHERMEHIPAADVKPVVHGKWIADGDGYHWTYNCSICGWRDGYPFNERHNYCPNCGAKMGKEI